MAGLRCRVEDELVDEIIRLEMNSRLAEISFIRIQQEMHNNVFRRRWHPEQTYIVGSFHEGMPSWVRGDHDQMLWKPTFPMVLWQSQGEQRGRVVMAEQDPNKLTLPMVLCQSPGEQRGGFVMAEQYPNELVYLKLRVVDKGSLHKDFRSAIDSDVYLKSSDFIEANLTNYDSNIEIHGPSIADNWKPGYVEFVQMSIDNVYCLKCQSWPPFTVDFFTRERLNKWPSQELLDKISCSECLVVPVGYPGSASNDSEWRLSFSLAERDLLHGIYEPYAKCMVALKAMKNKYIVYSDSDKPTPFCSYFIKTACLWMCETFPHTDYSLMDLIRKVLDWLIDCYQHKKLPHYFVPRHNLIGHITRECCDDVRAKLTAVKRDLWTMVISSLGNNCSWDNIITKICDILEIARDSGAAGYTTVETKLLNHQLPTNAIEGAIKMLRITYSYFENLGIANVAGFGFSALPVLLLALENHMEENLPVHIEETLRIPMESMLPIIENIEKIVPKGYEEMFKSRLYRYLGDVYTDLLLYLRKRGFSEALALHWNTPLHYCELGNEMVFPDKWSDEGIGSKVLVVKYHYLMGSYTKLKETLLLFEPILRKVRENEIDINRLPSIEITTPFSLTYSAWATDELLQHFVKRSQQLRFCMHPIVLVLYIKARVSLSEGDMDDASNIVKYMKECLKEITSLQNTNILIQIIEGLIGLLLVMRNVYFSK